MIVSVSRRTDIPAFYSDWFFTRLTQGFVYVKNPMNPHQISKISLSTEVIDCFIFWTKNPVAMIDRLHLLSNYHYYFQFTVTPYDKQLEPYLPAKSVIIETFIRLSNLLGKAKVIWRYDPIILTSRYSIEYHCRLFKEYASILAPYTNQCVISFIDLYRKISRNLDDIAIVPLTIDTMREIAYSFSQTAHKVGLKLVTCAEAIDLEDFGIVHGKCIDGRLITEISGLDFTFNKDTTQRPECGCVSSIDIGTYNTCPHGCIYCYANSNYNEVKKNFIAHNPNAPLLTGNIDTSDKISCRKMYSCRKINSV